MPDLIEHKGESLRVLDLVTVDEDQVVWLDGHAFRDCELVGPVVLILTQAASFEHCDFNVAQFWEIDPGRSYLGGIGLRNCTFHGCSFRDVGLATDRAFLRQLGLAL